MKIFLEKKLIYIIEIIFFIFLIIATNFSYIFTRRIIAIVLFLISLFCIKFIKNDSNKNVHIKQICLLVLSISVVYIMCLYIMGLYFGYYTSPVKLSFWSIQTFIIPYIVIIISSEIIRIKLYLNSNSNISKILITIAFVLLDIILTTDIKNLNGLEEYVTIISFVIFASIANNLLFNYMVNRFKTIRANIIYKIITTLYVFFIPITPNIYVFFESIIRILIPYIIYAILEIIYNKKKIVKTSKRKKEEIVFVIIASIFITLVVMLVSCKFTYGVLVIGSESMTGTINKGDIIFYKKYDDTNIKRGEILVFSKKDVTTVHRVIDMKETTEGIRYYTKGDANIQKDNGYIQKADIIGRVFYKISYIGYLNLWISDLFK